MLKADLVATARFDARLQAQTPFGQKYEVPVILRGPARQDLAVSVIWVVRRGEDFARLVTVYPRPQQ